MRLLALSAVLLAAASAAVAATPVPTPSGDDAPACLVGAYKDLHGDTLALVRSTTEPQSLRYVLASGSVGVLRPVSPGVMAAENQGPAGPYAAKLEARRCADPSVRLTLGDRTGTWTRVPLVRTSVRFDSDGVSLAGQLIRPAKASGRLPVMVYTHGSEAAAAINVNAVPILLAAKGVEGFVYDKRGTGDSKGVYTQDFERLGKDGARAIAEARRLTKGQAGRVGVWGASQGGWIAPFAARQAHADFVVVAYGVVGTPLEQDIWQIDYELAHLPFDTRDAQADVHRITAATAEIAASDFKDHLGDLAPLRTAYGAKPWFSKIEGQYTGELLRGEIERAHSESPQVIWRYDSEAVLRAVAAPQFWIMAQEDSVAVSAPSLKRLEQLRSGGKPIDVAVFPDTDHGIRTFRIGPDGQRIYTGLAPGYIHIIADWVNGRLRGPYGRASIWPAPERYASPQGPGPVRPQ